MLRQPFPFPPLLLDSFPECFIFNVFQCRLPLQGSTFDPACRHQSSANKSLGMFGHRDTATSSTSICSFFCIFVSPSLGWIPPHLALLSHTLHPFCAHFRKATLCCMHHGAFGSTFESRVNPFFCFCLHKCPKVFVVNWFQVQNLKKTNCKPNHKNISEIRLRSDFWTTEVILDRWGSEQFTSVWPRSPPLIHTNVRVFLFPSIFTVALPSVCVRSVFEPKTLIFPPPDCVNWI